MIRVLHVVPFGGGIQGGIESLVIVNDVNSFRLTLV